MPNLETLRWGIEPKSTHLFEAAFANADVTLPTVKHIVPAAYSEWLVRRCPNLQSLRAGCFFDHASWNSYDAKLKKEYDPMAALINATKGLPIEKLHLRSKWPSDWMDMLSAILDATPNITNLEMDGEIGSRWSGDSRPLDRHLKFLTKFPNLTSLALPSAGHLGLSFDGGPGCGNVYFGRGGRAYGRQVTEERAKTVEEAANMAMEALPHLKHLSVGGFVREHHVE
ncbi:hypothetical protein BU23DRAFT_575133 [Bimuria novae-zelandiae CBS 107.79]|uniref:F-box domain-containing protein n=1 Tax=Bimuria novae-zelandiae CBS 107.79 TaxID=1447943 RepID=A0A6A5UKG7_9PLEO|nr:hypothetical protein BU23DRAFT_575133 [Bimuria novae-zelandiae CBS 107.79]